MKIRVKIFLVVLPLIIVTLLLSEASSYFRAVNGITRIARQFLSFKSGELKKYADNQWDLLAENNYAGRPDMVQAAKNAVENYARSIVLSDTEIILALDESGSLAMSTSPLELTTAEGARILTLLKEENEGISSAVLGGKARTFASFYFTPFQWYVLLTEEDAAFYRDAEAIRFETMVVLAIALGLAALLLIFFTRHLTNPLSRVIKAMNAIITSGNLTSRVEVEYRDETGKLASTFNVMISELEKTRSQIKHYAFDAVLAGKKEERIRQIFQHYVPQDVINESFKNPEQLLPGKDMEMSILFSDIRNFTTISEEIGEPGVLVESLNRYFETEVDVIYKHNGWVDKYIGDAIMALWGAPVKHEDDVSNSVTAGLDMLEALKEFNAEQKKNNKKEFPIGIGINYGIVTVGNIGSTHKRDYTVIGDNVNLASRMEGLTKTYKSELLITESVYQGLKGGNPCRLLDKVAVKGKKEGVRIYTVKRRLSAEEEKAWACHNRGMELYFNRDFAGAAKCFREVLALLAGDFNATSLLQRCETYTVNPPPPEWDGIEVMHTK